MVADVAHELRNPVASLRAQVEGMSEGVLSVDAARLASVVDDTASLSRLVDDLHELTSADAGQLTYRREVVELGALVEAEVARAVDRAPAGVVVTAAVRERLFVDADPGRIAQVLRNLLDNALRHTDAGSITVSVEHGDDGARVAVTDTGEGIPVPDLPYVFERFYRAGTARERSRGGAGLGLSIARSIIEDHGGTVHAAARSGGGAVVGFTLPLIAG